MTTDKVQRPDITLSTGYSDPGTTVVPRSGRQRKDTDMSERTERLKQLLRNPLVQVNWCDTLANSNGWEIIHATIGRTDVLILGMGRSGYQVHKINHGPPQGESVEAEALRLAGKSAEEPEPDTSHDGIFA